LWFHANVVGDAKEPAKRPEAGSIAMAFFALVQSDLDRLTADEHGIVGRVLIDLQMQRVSLAVVVAPPAPSPR
jgi:hypothetical protein